MKQSSIVKLENLESYKSINDFSLICYAIMCMDPIFLESLLDDNILYEDIGKIKFVEKLNDRFTEHKTWGDSELLLDIDYCNGCNCNKPVCKFVGNTSGKHFALFFEFTHEEITDIYHCNWYGDLPF